MINLTPQDQQLFDNYKSNNPTYPGSESNTSGSQNSMLQDLQSGRWDVTKPLPSQAPQTPSGPSFGQDLGTSLGNAQKEMVGVASRSGIGGTTKSQSLPETILQTLGVGAKFGNDVIGDAAKHLGGMMWDNLPDFAKNVVHAEAGAILNSAPAQAGLEAAKQGIDKYNAWAVKNPRVAENVSALVNIPAFAAMFVGSGAAKGVGKAVTEPVETATQALEAGKNIAEGAKGFGQDVLQSGKDLVQGGKTAFQATKELPGTIKKAVTPKTLEEVLATPETDLAKLSKTERAAYFENANKLLSDKQAAIETGIKKQSEAKIAQLQTQAEELQRQAAVASRDEVLRLRPKIIQVLGQQSAKYRDLVSEAMAGQENMPVKAKELAGFVDSRYADNPDVANAIKEKLGLNEKTTTPLIGKSGKFEVPTGDTTLGKVYDRVKSLRQGISAGAKGATKVFTADDKMTDDAISTLVDFMQNKGVDLKEARQFWAKYAPIRNQLVSEAKPFLQTPTQTKTFASTLMRVAKGTDVNNENFIKEVENLIGEPVGKDVRATYAQLSQNEKEQLATKLAAEEQKANAKITADLEKQNLSKKAFEVNRKAGIRKWIKGIVLGTAGLGVGQVTGLNKAIAPVVHAATGGIL